MNGGMKHGRQLTLQTAGVRQGLEKRVEVGPASWGLTSMSWFIGGVHKWSEEFFGHKCIFLTPSSIFTPAKVLTALVILCPPSSRLTLAVGDS